MRPDIGTQDKFNVNEDGQHGTWRYELARSVDAVREILDAS